jgi:HEAT repeat protein
MRTRRAAEAGVAALAALALAAAAVAAQVPYETAMADLRSADAGVRLRTVEMLRDAAYPEAAVPLAALVTDPDDGVQLEAIAAELNIFLAEKVVSRRRVGLVVEVRTPVAAAAVFATGPRAIGPRSVPMELLDALRKAARDETPRVRLEALYAFGVLAVEPGGNRRRELLRNAGPDLAAMIGAVDPVHRYAAIRVIGRVFAHRPQDPPIEEDVGDAVVGVLNDRDGVMRMAAMETLGAMRYPRAAQALIDLFRFYGKGDRAAAALDAVAHIAHPSGLPFLESQLMAASAVFKRSAIEGLARAGDRTALAGIDTALRGEGSASLQLAGTFATAMLSTTPGEGFTPLVEALARPALRDQARGYLLDAIPGRAGSLKRYLADPDPAVRADLVDALGASDDPGALAVVGPLAGDPDVHVAQAVERAAARLRQVP